MQSKSCQFRRRLWRKSINKNIDQTIRDCSIYRSYQRKREDGEILNRRKEGEDEGQQCWTSLSTYLVIKHWISHFYLLNWTLMCCFPGKIINPSQLQLSMPSDGCSNTDFSCPLPLLLLINWNFNRSIVLLGFIQWPSDVQPSFQLFFSAIWFDQLNTY